MKQMHKKLFISLATVSLLFSGCNRNDDTTSMDNTTSTEKTAYLIDSAVEGIDYTCGTLTGTTDSTGKFTYDSTKCPTGVEFKLGSLSLGTINLSTINTDTYLTIQELAGTTRDNVTDGNVTKLAVLLQSLDDDNNSANGIVITDTIKGYFGTDGNISSKTDSEISSLIATTVHKTEKDIHEALAHLLAYTKSKDSSVTTIIAPQDFNLTSVSGSALNTPTSSNTITIGGLTIPTYITISNGSEYSINGGIFKSTKSLVRNDDNVTVRHTTANSLSRTTTTTLKIGGVTKTFGSTTKSTLVFQSGDTWKGLQYNTITSPVTQKVWLDRNLGATQVCTSSTDTACYGDYYQWGRDTDGHESNVSDTNTTLATNLNTTGNSSFITNSSSPYDWTALDSNGALRSANWSKTDGSSVCPVGYKVPTKAELVAETISSSADAFTKLKLPSAGYRDFISDSLLNQGSQGYIWSSSLNGSYSWYLKFDSSGFGGRAGGQSVRCLLHVVENK